MYATVHSFMSDSNGKTVWYTVTADGSGQWPTLTAAMNYLAEKGYVPTGQEFERMMIWVKAVILSPSQPVTLADRAGRTR